MSPRAAIAGSASRLGHRFDRAIDLVIRETVLEALRAAALDSLERIDAVVTVASDTLDGVMVPSRAGVAGAFGRGYLNIPSAAGHALAAAAALIETGQALTVLVAGWGEGSKLRDADSRGIQADPFHARPIGADPATLAAMQAHSLVTTGVVDAATARRDVERMRQRAWPRGDAPTSGSGMASLIRPCWCDGAAALVLSGDENVLARKPILRDFGMSSRGYCPEPDDFDPGGWVAAAMAAMRDPGRMAQVAPATIEISSPTPFVERRAAEPLLAAVMGDGDAQINPSGGGASYHFGSATGLRSVILAAGALGGGRPPARRDGVVLDLAGPIGQAATVLLLQGSPAP